MALLNSGVGNMVGYLGSGLWFAHSSSEGRTQWPIFWGGLGVAMVAVLIFFLAMYRGQNRTGASMH
jgi:O-antigen/teichoic acid export membrane protein